MSNEEFLRKLQERVTYAAARVGSEIAEALKNVVSVPAPLVPGSNPPRAATRATPGAPPRVVSGWGRANVAYYVANQTLGTVTLMVGNPVIYMAVHERGNHQWLMKTIRAMMPKIVANFNRYLTMERL